MRLSIFFFSLILLNSLKANAQAKISFAQLDTIDFQFAMTVNGNISFYDILQEGENRARMNQVWKDGALIFSPEKNRIRMGEAGLERAMVAYSYRMYKLAESQFVKTKIFMEQNGLRNSIRYLRCISSLGLICLVQGRTLEAEQYIRNALENSMTTLGQKSAAYAANLNSKATLDEFLGKYSEAEKAFDESIELVAQVFGKNTTQYAIVLNNKAMLFQEVGRYDEGVELMKNAVAVSEAAQEEIKFAGKSYLGKNTFDQRKFQSNLAELYQLSGRFSEAENTFLGIKNAFENRGQTNNPEYASMLNQLANLYIQIGKIEQAELLYQKSGQVYKKKFTEENPSFAKVQSDLGNFYRMRGKFAEVEAALLKAAGIQRRTLGEYHPDYVKSVENLGILYWKKGDFAAAYANLNEATTKSLDFINRYFPPMSEAEKTKYWDVLQPRFQRFYNYAIEASAKNPSILGDVYDYQIATKALLLNSTNKIKKAILASGDEALIKDYRSWITEKETLARYYAFSKDELKKQDIDINTLEKAANDAERSLSQRSSDFSKGYATEKISYKRAASLLGEDEVLVEIVRVHTFDVDFTHDSRYVALILNKDSDLPKMIVLDNGNQMETRYAKFYKNAVTQKIVDENSYDQYWSRIEPLLGGKKTIYLSPDGVYNQINVNTLRKTGGDFVINRFDIVVIGNSKDLIAIKEMKKVLTEKDAFLLGFPDYGGNAVALPGTKEEIEEINKILETSGFHVTQRQQKEASETNLKAIKRPSLVHIATHGYFLADADLKSGDALGINARYNPLLRSGLLLAGTPDPNKDSPSPDLQSNDNGVLTAYEAMNLNLEGTDLVVLSACETGLGNVKAGEGVYGLQRAFLVAGANALIMSLWKVDDTATQQLMTNFYINWIKLGNKQKAFKQAQFQLMTNYNDPYYWGAFVMMGM